MDDADDGPGEFLELLEPEQEPDLDRAALVFARAVEYPALDVDAYLARLDGMAGELRPRISPEEPPGRIVARINEYLFGEQGFHGNELEYYDPRNSYLNEVLDRRLGIPITLSTVYLAVARRLGIRLEGIGMPGHFLLRYPDPAEPLLLDAFNRGAIITEAECRGRLRGTYGDALPLTSDMLRPVGVWATLFRMLGNLKAIYTRQEDFARAVRVVNLMRTIRPDAIDEHRDIGLLYFRMGRFKVARGELEFYLRKRPDAPDAPLVREQLALISRLEVMRN